MTVLQSSRKSRNLLFRLSDDMFDTSDLICLTLGVMRQWPLYTHEGEVTAFHCGNDQWAIKYNWHRKMREWSAGDAYTGFSLNYFTDRRVLYLLSIHLHEKVRGQGHGRQLYDSVIEIGRQIGAREVRQTPSGWTYTGERRRDYLVRHGWTPTGNNAEVFITLDHG